MSHHQRQLHVRARTTKRLDQFIARIEMMRPPDIEVLRKAFLGDLAQAGREGNLRGVAFCIERLGLIDQEQARREREGEWPRPDAGTTES